MLIFAVAAYVLVQLGIGWWAARHTRTETDYFVAGRSLGLFAVTLSLFATWFGAESVMGSSAAIAEGGLAQSRAEPLGYVLCLVLMGLFVAGKLRAGGYVTLADFFRDRFGPQAETWCVIANLPSSVIWAGAQMTALGTIMSALTGVDPALTLAFSAILVMVYTSMGGLMGDVATDVLQGIILLVGLVVLLGFIVARAGGPSEALALIPPAKLDLLGSGEGLVSRLDSWAIPVLGSLVTSEAIARFLGSRTAKVARNASFCAAGLYLATGLIPVLVGLIGPELGLTVTPGDLYLPKLAAQLLPPVFYVLLIGALLSAILSTVDSNILSVSSLVTRNGFDRIRPNASEKTKLWTARLVTVGAAVAAWMIATSGEGIYKLVEWASAFGSSGVLIGFLFGAYSLWGDGRAAVGAILCGFTSNFVTIILPSVTGGEAVEGAFLMSVAASLIAYLTITVLGRRMRSSQDVALSSR